LSESPAVKVDPEAIIARVRRFVEGRGLLPAGIVVVAVSGGQDSVCMLDVLNRLQVGMGIRLHVAHLDHRFRGAQSASEAEYVRELALGMGLPVTVASIDVPAYRMEHRLSKQVAARYARLRFLSAVAAQVGADRVAVGHTADDAVETFLLNLLRGSGLAGLGGIPPSRRLERGQLGPELESRYWSSLPLPLPSGPLPMAVRPILALSRGDTEGYCQARGLRFRSDPSNLDTAYRRNWVRVELLPTLERYSPNVRERLRNAAELLADDHAIVSEAVERCWVGMARIEQGRVEFDLAAWRQQGVAIQRQLLRRAFEVLAGSLEGFGRVHVDAAEAAVREGLTGTSIDLPVGIRLEKGYTSFHLYRSSGVAGAAASLVSPVPLAVPGTVTLADGVLEASLLEAGGGSWGEWCSGSRWEACLDAEKVGTSLVVRRRAVGDRFVPLGMERAKKLHDFLVDEKVPRRERDRVPLVATPTEIVWVVGHRLDDRFKVTPETRRIVRIVFHQSGGDR